MAFRKFLILLLFFGSFHSSLVWSESFQDLWTRQNEGEIQVLSSSLRKNLYEKHVFYVGGILNELAALINCYYYDNIEATESLGMTTQLWGPPTGNPIDVNAKILFKRIKKTAQDRGKPLTLVGHSKGGVEVLYTILAHPELILKGMVEKVVLLQAPVGGSPLASDDNLNLVVRGISAFFQKGLHSLDPTEIKFLFDNVYARFERSLSPEEIREVASKIYYVRSQHSGSLSYGLQLVLAFMRTSLDLLGPNDGMVLTEDQVFKRDGVVFGNDLGVVVADHMKLAVSGMFTSGYAEERRSFTEVLFSIIYGTSTKSTMSYDGFSKTFNLGEISQWPL